MTDAISGKPSLSASKRIPELDGLRGMAILIVVVNHYTWGGEMNPSGSFLRVILSPFRLGWSGVDLFFILSGFLIGGILLDARGSSRFFRTFYFRRAHRIIPIYYVLLFLYALFACLNLGKLYAPVELSPLKPLLLPVHLLFLQNIVHFPLTYFSQQWLSSLWSLAVEEQFYLVAPVLIYFLPNRYLIRILLAVVFIAPVVRVILLRMGHPGGMYALTPARADELAMGVLVASLWRVPKARDMLTKHRNSLRITLGVLFLVTGALALLAPESQTILMGAIGFSLIGLFYTFLLVLVLSNQSGVVAWLTRLPILRRFGTISYCMYLIHGPINPVTHWFIRHDWPAFATSSEITVTLLAFGFTCALASLSWKYFEKPLVRRGHRYSY